MGKLCTMAAAAALSSLAACPSTITCSAAPTVGNSSSDVKQHEVRVSVTSGPTDCSQSDRVAEGRYLSLHYDGTIDETSESGEIGLSFDSSRRVIVSPPLEETDPTKLEEDGSRQRQQRSADGPNAAADADASASVDETRPLTFRLGIGTMIPGFESGLIGLCRGAFASMVVPPPLGYGSVGAGAVVPPGATLRFDVEILDVTDDPPPQLEEEPNMFADLDEDGDGRLNAGELERFFEMMGMDGGVPDELWEREDVDGDGYISWEEFGGPKEHTPPGGRVSGENRKQQSSSTKGDEGKSNEEASEEEEEEPPRREEFDAIDADSDGRLSHDEVEQFFSNEGLGDVPLGFWEEEDSNGDGFIDPGEFGLPQSEWPEEVWRRPEEEDLDPEVEFERIDSDGDGRLNKAEVEEFFRTTLGEDVPPGFWEEEDSDGDGYISAEEFMGPPIRGEFEDIDADEDGRLSREEVKTFFESVGEAVPEGLWEDEDTDGDGYIGLEEFSGPRREGMAPPAVGEEL